MAQELPCCIERFVLLQPSELNDVPVLPRS